MDADASQQSNRWFAFLGWLEVNKQKVAIGAGIALALGLIIALVLYNLSQRELRASQALSEVRATTNPMQPPPPGLAEAYFKVAKEYSGTKAGMRAALIGAGSLFVDGNYTGAQQKYEEFISKYPDSPWLAQANVGIAASLAAQQKTADAITKYEEVRKRYSADPVANEAKLALGRLYEQQNKPEEAYKLFDELFKGDQYSVIGAEAESHLATLEKKYPQLAKTNAPPPTMPANFNPAMLRSNLNMQAASNRPTINMSNVIKTLSTNAAAHAPQLAPTPQTAPSAQPPSGTPAPAPVTAPKPTVAPATPAPKP